MIKFIKKHKTKIIFIIGLLFFGIAGSSAASIIFASSEVSFDNTTAGAQGLSSTNVQDAIDEVYAEANYCPKKVLVGGNKIELVTSGNGLYADSVEKNRYIYRGKNPNNYICLASGSGSCAADDLYRIIAIETNGTLKVIKNSPFVGTEWDKSSTRSAGSTYCVVSYGCNSWGSSTSTYASDGSTKVTVMPREAGSSTTYTLPTLDAYLNVYLNGGEYPSGTNITSWLSTQNSVITSNIVDYAYNVGPLKLAEGQTIATDVSQESAYKWIGKVALMNATDYVRASTNSSCTGAYAYYNTSACYTGYSYTWMYTSYSEWTLSPYSASSSPIYAWYHTSGSAGTSMTSGGQRLRPVFHLKSSITLTGSGTNDANVYRIS